MQRVAQGSVKPRLPGGTANTDEKTPSPPYNVPHPLGHPQGGLLCITLYFSNAGNASAAFFPGFLASAVVLRRGRPASAGASAGIRAFVVRLSGSLSLLLGGLRSNMSEHRPKRIARLFSAMQASLDPRSGSVDPSELKHPSHNGLHSLSRHSNLPYAEARFCSGIYDVSWVLGTEMSTRQHVHVTLAVCFMPIHGLSKGHTHTSEGSASATHMDQQPHFGFSKGVLVLAVGHTYESFDSGCDVSNLH